MIKILPYKKSLLEGFIYNGVEKELTGEEISGVLDFYNKLGSVYVGLVDDKVIGVGGVYYLWNNMGGCFLFLNKEAHLNKLSVFKAICQYTDELIKKYNIKNLLVDCISASKEANRLIKHLGFKKYSDIKMARYFKGE